MFARGIRHSLAVVVTLLAGACGSGSSEPAVKWPALAMLDLPEVERTFASGISADGSVVSVFASPYSFDGVDTIGVRIWRADGVQDLDMAGSAPMLSRDGMIIAGTRFLGITRVRYSYVITHSEPFRWSRSGGVQTFPADLGAVYPWDMTADGDMFTGMRATGPDGPRVPAVWSFDGPVVDLEPVPDEIDGLPARWPQPLAISSDGRVVVGFVSAIVVEPPPVGVSESRALLWEETGLRVLPTAEGLLDCEAVDVSRSGAIIVGRCGEEFERDGVAARRSIAVVWEGDRGRILPFVGGAESTRGRFVSDDGRVVVGNWYSVAETGVFAWSEATGTVRLRDLLISSGHGNEISDLSFEEVAGVSSDGRIIAGTAYDAERRPYAFRAELPNA